MCRKRRFFWRNIASSFVILLRKKRIRAAAPNTGEVPPPFRMMERPILCVCAGGDESDSLATSCGKEYTHVNQPPRNDRGKLAHKK